MISREQAEKGLGKTDSFDVAKDQKIQEARSLRIEADGREQYFSLRKIWSVLIIIWISVLIIFNVVLTLLVGIGWLHFENMQWFITAVTVETFLQIVGMGYIAVRFLFSHR